LAYALLIVAFLHTDNVTKSVRFEMIKQIIVCLEKASFHVKNTLKTLIKAMKKYLPKWHEQKI